MSTALRAPSWAGDPPHTDAARGRLVDAAARCIAADGLRSVSVAGVATEAGVSRPTVYRYFADRDELIGATLTIAADGLRGKILERIEPLPSAAEMIVEAVVLAVREIPTDPVLAAMWDSGAADPTVIEQFTRPIGLTWARDALAPAIAAANWSDGETDEAMEVLLRVALSFLVSPAPLRSDAEMRALLHRRVIPGLDLPANHGVRP